MKSKGNKIAKEKIKQLTSQEYGEEEKAEVSSLALQSRLSSVKSIEKDSKKQEHIKTFMTSMKEDEPHMKALQELEVYVDNLI